MHKIINKNQPKSYMLLFLSLLLGSYISKTLIFSKKPNLLIITSDDLRAADMYPYAAKPLQHLNNLIKIADESTVFITDTVYPICNPSRNAFLTGRDFPQVITFDQNFFALSMQSFLGFLRNNGYHVGMFGKVMHEYTPDLEYQLFQEMNQTSEARYPLFDGYSDCADDQIGCKIPAYKSTDHTIVKYALSFLERMKPDTPWVLAVGFYRTHLAMTYTEHHHEYYKIRLPNYTRPVIETSGNFQLAHNDYTKLSAYKIGKDRVINSTADELSKHPSLVRKIRGMYFNSLAYLDSNIGILIRALHRLGFIENTIIIFTADHGFMLGEKDLWGKSLLYEEATRIPLLIKVPWLKKSKASVAISRASIIDIFPTILELLLGKHVKFIDNSGIPLRGKSLVPALYDHKIKINEHTFFRYGRCQPLNISQSNVCVTDDEGPCSRPPIIYMGHGIVLTSNSTECRYIAWWPFIERRNGCMKPSWYNKPDTLKGYGKISPQLNLHESYTDFSVPEIQPELYCHPLYSKYGERGHPNSDNLAISPNEESKHILQKAKRAIINRYSPII